MFKSIFGPANDDASKRASALELHSRYGELFVEVKSAFLSMSHEQLTLLLEDYRREYGEGPANYAGATIPKWRLGLVRMSGTTMERMLDLVPRHLSTERKMELIAKLRAHALSKLRKTQVKVKVAADESVTSLLDRITKLVVKQIEIGMPKGLSEIQGWLYQGDSLALEQLVLEQERETLYALVADLYWNVRLAQRLRSLIGSNCVARVEFEIPTAHVIIEVRKPRGRGLLENDFSMDQDVITQIVRAESDSRFADGKMTAQEYMLRNLDRYFTPKQQDELRLIAAKQGLELDKMKTEVMLRGQTSAHDIEQFKKLLEDLKKAGAKADIEGSYQTPSGSVMIKAKTRPFGCTSVLMLGMVLVLLAFLVR